MVDAPRKTFGQRLRSLIAETGKSRAEVAREVGIEGSAISRWVNDQNEPAYANLVALCRHFGVTADWLLGLSEHRDAREPSEREQELRRQQEDLLHQVRRMKRDTEKLTAAMDTAVERVKRKG